MPEEGNILFNRLPDATRPFLKSFNISDSDIVVAMQSDLDLEGEQCTSWLILTSDQILSVTPCAKEKKVIGPFEIKNIERARMHAGVGNSFLQVKTEKLFINLVRFSNAKREEFNRVRVYLHEKIRTGEGNEDIFHKKNPWFCDSCGLALPSREAICPRCAARGGLLKRTLKLMVPYQQFVILLLVLMLAGVTLDLMPPYLTRILVDDVLTNKTHVDWLVWLVLALAVASLTRAVLNIFIGRTSTYIGTRITYELRQKLEKKLSSLSVDFYDKYPVGSLISRMVNDIDYFHGFVQQVAQGFLVNIFRIVGIGFMLFKLNTQLAIYVLIPIPFVIAGTWFFWHVIYPRYHKYWDSRSKITTLINGMLTGIRTVKAFAQEAHEGERFRRAAEYLRDSRRSVEMRTATFYPIFGFVLGRREEFSQIVFAVPEPTLENSFDKKLCSVVDFVNCSILISIPSSTP